MDFGLSEEQVLLKNTVARFLAEQCPTTRVRTVMETDTGHDGDLWQEITALGIAGLNVPEEFGGSGLELLDVALVAEEFGYAATPGPFLGNAMAVVGLLESDHDELRREWLPRIASGEAIGTVAIGEADAEWSPDRMQATVENGRLSGNKPLVPNARIADFMLVAARDASGPGLWFVETSATGVEAKQLKVVDMTRKVDAVSLGGAPATALGGGQKALQRVIDAGCILIAADAYGGSRRALDMAVDYAKQRKQFGQMIGAFQAVKHQLADMLTELEPSLALWWYAAHAFDHITDKSERHAALVKAHLADVFDRIARDSTELHGGIGFTWEFDLQLWFRRSIFDGGFLGDSAYHRARAADLAAWT